MTAHTLKKQPPKRHALTPQLAATLSSWGSGIDSIPMTGTRTTREFISVLSFAACEVAVESEETKATWNLILGRSREATLDQVDIFVRMTDETARSRGFSGRAGFTPLRCPCGHVGEPTLAWTWLGDLVWRVGAWCRYCREWAQFHRSEPDVVALVPPWVWLPFGKKLPEPGAPWPTARSCHDSRLDFPFGENEGVSPHELVFKILNHRDPKRYGEDTLYGIRRETQAPVEDQAIL